MFDDVRATDGRALAGLVFAGGCMGTWSRLALDAALPAGPLRPSLVAVNLVGALILGWLAGRRDGGGGKWANPAAYALFGTGFCGAFTTYSGLVGGWLTGTPHWLAHTVTLLAAGVACAAAGWWAGRRAGVARWAR